MVMLRKDNFLFGQIVGLLLPVVSFFGYYLWKFRVYSFSDYLFYLRTNKALVTAITIPCLVLNMVIFTYYINSKLDKTAKGVFAATLLYALASLVVKYFG
jgi:hypothetical protein